MIRWYLVVGQENEILPGGGDVLASFHGQGRGVCIINNIDLENVERY
jgi:hypothetical protein